MSRNLDTAERTAKVVEMRRGRASFREIAAAVGCSTQYAHRLYYQALADIPATEVVQARQEECELVDDAVVGLLKIANDPEEAGRTRVEAWTSLRGWSEHRARLLGLNAPATSRVQLISESDIDAEIARLTRELADNDRPADAVT